MNPTLSGIACFFATAPEARWLKRRFRSKSRIWLKPSLLDWGLLSPPLGSASPLPLLIVETGMGPKAAEAAARYAFRHFPLKEAWIFGLAAAARKGIQTGEALLATAMGTPESLTRPEGKTWEEADVGLLARAQKVLEELKMPLYAGPLLTTERVIHSPAEKLALGEQFGCLGIEMEATPIAAEARGSGLPCAQVRWVSDAAEDALPQVDDFVDERGRPRPFAPLFGLLRRPGLMLDLPPFLWKVRRALAAQNRFLQKWLEDERMAVY